MKTDISNCNFTLAAPYSLYSSSWNKGSFQMLANTCIILLPADSLSQIYALGTLSSFARIHTPMGRYTPRWPVQWVPNINYPEGQAGATDVLMKAVCIHIRQCDGTRAREPLDVFWDLCNWFQFTSVTNAMWCDTLWNNTSLLYFLWVLYTWHGELNLWPKNHISVYP